MGIEREAHLVALDIWISEVSFVLIVQIRKLFFKPGYFTRFLEKDLMGKYI